MTTMQLIADTAGMPRGIRARAAPGGKISELLNSLSTASEEEKKSKAAYIQLLSDYVPTEGFWVVKSGDPSRTLGLDLPWAKKKRWFTIKDSPSCSVLSAVNQVGLIEYFAKEESNKIVLKGSIPIFNNTVPELHGKQVFIPTPNRTYKLHAESCDEADVIYRVIHDFANQLLIWDHWSIPYEYLNFEKEIGSGAFGEVWRAQMDSPILGKATVAVKRLKSESVIFNKLASKGFIIEGRCMRSLSHPNVVRFYGAGYLPKDEGGLPFLVTEFADKGTLRNELASTQELPWDDRFSFAVDITRGLEYIHSHGCIHRDLKSDNILIFGKTAKISDFGTSKRIFDVLLEPVSENDNVSDFYEASSTSTTNSSSSGLVGSELKSSSSISSVSIGSLNLSARQTVAAHTRMTGTPLWMAPEVFSRKPYGQPSDIYSLGMVYFELATRKIPWADENLGKFMSQLEDAVVSGRRPKIPEDCPPGFSDLIQKCWSNDPDARPSTSQALVCVYDIMGLNDSAISSISITKEQDVDPNSLHIGGLVEIEEEVVESEEGKPLTL